MLGVQFRLSSTTGFTNWFVDVRFDADYSGAWAGFDPLNGAPEGVVVTMPASRLPLTGPWFTSPPFLVGTTSYRPRVRITLSDAPIPVGLDPMGWEGSAPSGTFDFNGQPAFGCGETQDYCGQIVILPSGFSPERANCKDHPKSNQWGGWGERPRWSRPAGRRCDRRRGPMAAIGCGCRRRDLSPSGPRRRFRECFGRLGRWTPRVREGRWRPRQSVDRARPGVRRVRPVRPAGERLRPRFRDRAAQAGGGFKLLLGGTTLRGAQLGQVFNP